MWTTRIGPPALMVFDSLDTSPRERANCIKDLAWLNAGS